MPFNRDRLTKVAFIAAFAASAMAVAATTLHKESPRSTGEVDFKLMFIPAKPISEEPAPRL